MPGKYQITAEFSLETRIEPEGVRFHGGDAEDFEDNSSFSDADVECYGGEIAFVVEADNEDEALSKSEDEIFEGMEAEDGNGFTWVVGSLQVNVEEIVPPMDMERALTTIRAFISRMREMGGVNAEEEEAFSFLLDNLTP